MAAGEITKTHARAPGLDGVRALAVLAVNEGASELSVGFLGVDIFFVLSGFLITDLLVARYWDAPAGDCASVQSYGAAMSTNRE